ncbi:hypothetical protein Q4511_01050 [Paracoccus sp. 1_MG-2023]|uniref:hypothetical protein n=1 Tax=unclassified Paracoccus (in: a-proteobacteria) TaxID=2688777 RepID=UPI001C093D0C|nr:MULTISPECIES: hypothetical protein [unclassified Paracoccus (in: a-proteobacteria)]MBU2957653.1 hypothetical protein [Paracoccus sp. C2R09]MDO6667499.1 hypothetical protein [Paracoccus sp. 1_MG-2023]
MRLAIAIALLGSPAIADPAIVEAVDATRSANGWRFDVTLRHPDTGWDHYADAWQVLDADGNVLGLRELAHPHETEQPFTRSLSGVQIPDGIDTVYVQARCLIDGWGDKPVPIALPE